jgi:hypothetical protein
VRETVQLAGRDAERKQWTAALETEAHPPIDDSTWRPVRRR